MTFSTAPFFERIAPWIPAVITIALCCIAIGLIALINKPRKHPTDTLKPKIKALEEI